MYNQPSDLYSRGTYARAMQRLTCILSIDDLSIPNFFAFLRKDFGNEIKNLEYVRQEIFFQ